MGAGTQTRDFQDLARPYCAYEVQQDILWARNQGSQRRCDTHGEFSRMANSDQKFIRPRAGDGSSTGIERYMLLKAAFAHAQLSIRSGHYLEAMTVLESILTDRLGSMVGGALGHEVTLRLTLSGLIKLAKLGPAVDKESTYVAPPKKPFPDDLIGFLSGPMTDWWMLRNDAIHGMAKLRHVSDTSFSVRHSRLLEPALDGVRVLLELDRYDQREKSINGAGRSATWPDALAVDADIMARLAIS